MGFVKDKAWWANYRERNRERLRAYKRDWDKKKYDELHPIVEKLHEVQSERMIKVKTDMQEEMRNFKVTGRSVCGVCGVYQDCGTVNGVWVCEECIKK